MDHVLSPGARAASSRSAQGGLRRGGLGLVAIGLVGCAMTGAKPRPPSSPTVAPSLSCRPRARLISPSSSAGGDGSLIGAASGYALVWSERIGERSALRFLAVDAHGNPKSPSSEVIDRPTAISSPTIAADAAGYLVAWSEGATRYARPLDARGRPRADVVETSELGVSRPSSACVAKGPLLVCRADEQRVLELSAPARLVAEVLAPGALGLISQDGEGLRLWVMDCELR